ncbi:MAG: class II aldolase/adducin family protein [Candidatus Omnitrophota bacterium]|nr:MAG: class II aldolase/adducin family protein [Candidatus Omnitrophota bacterium]
MSFKKEKKELIYWAGLLNQKGLVTVKSGNLSWRVDKDKILITSHNSYLGYLEEKEILLVNAEGNILKGEGELTSEQALHLSIYKKFNDTKVVLHAHSPYTTAFFCYFDKLESFSYETKFYLGDVEAIVQTTPTVTEIKPVLSALDKNNIVVLKNHGVVAIGSSFKETGSLVELLEEQAKVNLLIKSLHHKDLTQEPAVCVKGKETAAQQKKYRMLSKEHAEKLTNLVNNDKEAQELGKKYDLTCTLAVKNQETGQAMCFYYQGGRITKVDTNDNAEFVIIGKEDILKKVFNQEINPFVAQTQGKVKTKGDFSKMSRWYPVMVRTFKLWEQAPVE